MSLSFKELFMFDSAGDQTLDLLHAMQALYQ